MAETSVASAVGTEGSFNLVLRDRALRSLSLLEEGDSASEITGSIGRVQGVAVIEGVLLEVRGSRGTLRVSLPRRFLTRLGRTSVEDRPREGGG